MRLLVAYHAVAAAAVNNPAVIINWNKECLNEGRMPHSTPFGSVITHSIIEQDDSSLTSKELAAVNRIKEFGIRDTPAQLPLAEPGSVESYVNRVIDVLTGVSQLDLQAALTDLSVKTTDVVATSTNQELADVDGMLPLNATPVPDNRNLGIGHLAATFEILGRYIDNMPTNSELTPSYLTELQDDVIPGSVANEVAVALSEILPCVNIVELAKERRSNDDVVGHITEHMPEDWEEDCKTYNDPGACYQWYMGNTWGGWFQQAIEYFDEATDASTLSEMPVVVIDNECAVSNLDLDFYTRQGCTVSSSETCKGWDSEDRDYSFWISDPNDAHGTLAASMIAPKTSNQMGIAATCPVCKVYCIKAATSGGVFYTDALLRAYNHVLLNVSQFKISNNSYGGAGFVQSEFDAIQLLSNAGHVFVAAAGNDSCHLGSDQCRFDAPSMYNIANLVTVGALTITGSKASFSNYGDEVDLMAPGQYTPGLGDFTDSDIIKFVSGTSFSSPIVTAAIAMALALRPNESNQNIFTAAYDSASYSETIPGSYAKSGALNAYGLLRNTVTPGVYAGQKLKSSGFRVAAPLVIAICVVLLL